jgi:multidrug efflux pump subunit AcrB
MAASLMFGLAFSVLLCLIVTPMMYAIFFRIHETAAGD